LITLDNILELVKVTKKINGQDILKNISMSIKRGEFLTILGPSGCGKTTTLRMIAGFERPTSGNIFLNGSRIDNKEPYELSINTVFQNYALFPHMNVYDNIAYGLKIKKIDKKTIKERVNKMLEIVRLKGYEKRMPKNLSGGQRQRVAIARALVNNPDVLLLDEPLGALDFKLRKQMQVELKNLQRNLGITFIYVTHDQEEALNMSDRIIIMKDGVIEQIGTPMEIYEKPHTKFVADFIGESNIFDCIVDSVSNGIAYLKNENGYMGINSDSLKKGDKVCLMVRPENIKFSLNPKEKFLLRGKVISSVYLGSNRKITFKLENGSFVILNNYVKGAYLPQVGEYLWLYWNFQDAVIIQNEDEGENSKEAKEVV
jgi:spermidine/putrescine transport system ATP-binding protein